MEFSQWEIYIPDLLENWGKNVSWKDSQLANVLNTLAPIECVIIWNSVKPNEAIDIIYCFKSSATIKLSISL